MTEEIKVRSNHGIITLQTALGAVGNLAYSGVVIGHLELAVMAVLIG